MILKVQRIKWFLSFGLICIASVMIWAQAKPKQEPKNGQAYLNDKETYTGTISVEKFLQLIGKPVFVKSENGNYYPVMQFSYSYAERGLYEDEKGNPIINVDYLYEKSTDKLSQGMLTDMYYRAKAGDTAFIDYVFYKVPDTKNPKKFALYRSKGVKLVLTQ